MADANIEARLLAITNFVEDMFKDGVCLQCSWRTGEPIGWHRCWVGQLDALLHSGAESTTLPLVDPDGC